MTGRCSHCHAKTMALPGAMPRQSRPNPPTGWKRGYVVESLQRSYLTCADCIHRSLLAAA